MISESARKSLANPYIQRINLVLDYVTEHFAEPLSLETLADVAGFSPYHFHRIFKLLLDENVNSYVVRRRLERAVALMHATDRLSITHIALDCGFESLSNFSRTFKQHFGVSPSRWTRTQPLHESKIRQAEPRLPLYDAVQLSEDEKQFVIEFKTLPTQTLAYVRVYDPYSGMNVLHGYQHLMRWAQEHTQRGVLVGMSQDHPDVTPAAQCRYDIGMLLPEGAAPVSDETVSIRPFPTCRVAAIHCMGDIGLVDRAWQYLYRYWLPRSRFLPDNLPAMECFLRTPEQIGWEMFDLDCWLPIIPL